MNKYLVASQHGETYHVHLLTDNEPEARDEARRLAAKYPQRKIHIYQRFQSVQVREELTWQ